MIIPECVLEAIRYGVRPTIEYRNGKFWLDMNTGMKSGLYIMLGGDTFPVEMRYDKTDVLEIDSSPYELASLLRSCMCGRDYLSATMIEFLEKY